MRSFAARLLKEIPCTGDGLGAPVQVAPPPHASNLAGALTRILIKIAQLDEKPPPDEWDQRSGFSISPNAAQFLRFRKPLSLVMK